jgi:hypothetical protein
MQRETPPELMGRVSTSASAIPTGLQMFAPIAGAALAEWQSVGFVFSLAGGGLAALGLVVLAVRPPVGVGVTLAAAADVASAAAGDAGAGAGTSSDAVAASASASSGSGAPAAEPAVMAGAAKDQGRAAVVRSDTTNKEGRMSDDLEILKSAGFNLDELSPEQVDAVGNLSRDELETLAAIRGKLNAEPEVSGHLAKAAAGDGNFVW